MDRPLVSVLMTLYNHEKFVDDAINSVLNQSYKNWELLIANDCSTDNSENVVKSFKDKRIRYFKNEQNQGTIISLNSLIKKAKGEYVAILDSDDYWTVDKLECQISFMQNNLEYFATFTHAEIVNENGKIYSDGENDYLGINTYKQKNKSQAEMISWFFKNGNCLAHTSLVFKRSIIKEIGLHDVRFRQYHDFEFYTRLISKFNFSIIEKPLLNVRRISSNNNSVSCNSSVNFIRCRNEIVFLIYRMIDYLPKELFENAFTNEIIKPIKTEEDLICEKYFLLKSWKLDNTENFIPAILYISKYINNESILTNLKKKYNFSIDAYYSETSKIVQLYPQNFYDFYNVLDTEFHKIINSKSWKITKPLRAFGALFKKN